MATSSAWVVLLSSGSIGLHLRIYRKYIRYYVNVKGAIGNILRSPLLFSFFLSPKVFHLASLARFRIA